MRAADLEIPFRGVRRAADAGPAPATPSNEPGGIAWSVAESSILESAHDYACCMTQHEFFSHVTAAVIWGIPIPHALVVPDELHVSVLAPHRASKRPNVSAHQARAGRVTVTRHPATGLRVSSPASTWASLGAVLTHHYDVVAAADAVVRVPRMPAGFPFPPDARTEPLASVAELKASVAAGRRVGVEALRTALPRVRTGAASRPEAWTRLTLVDNGLPEPVLDYDVFDEYGTFVACLDMAYPELKIAIEYDGDHHRTDRQQWSRDIDRLEALAALGWHVIRVDSRLLFRAPGELVRRVRAARDRRLA
ncbi:endonuclease domain-containing protein [Humibacter ginsenosidimutans]|uniref:DUF559 domain-containing protein n=1 Tax=Humibacter ginsenosidimutans TaxID=2599293 RepID=A0A5B8M407_9MICO|nr:DUF559 domain-containing protein [Humibacter ginsenosidimutans]QDZ15026.1 DUF559 domain-containing protein [Humibacter ginsenosidimutans]